jgi:NTE family protein
MSVRRASLLLLVLGACAHPVETPPLQTIDQFQGYRSNVLEKQAPKALGDTAVILSFSGGGTRAAALADGVLRGLAKIEIPSARGPVRLVDQIDVISSVSGGSVTAAYYALKGYQGLDVLERDFLRQDVMSRLNCPRTARSRHRPWAHASGCSRAISTSASSGARPTAI